LSAAPRDGDDIELIAFADRLAAGPADTEGKDDE
jgi:hypothetical protein